MKFLLINPPIYDFAAYDLWLKPLGLLYIASILKNSGANINLIDCMDRNHPALLKPVSNRWGCGKYLQEEVQKPEILKKIPRKYKRYGMPHKTFKKALENTPKPDVILITSGMTYWYPGVIEAINTMKGYFPGIPVILGGIYASLCYDHAIANSGADYVVKGNNLSELFRLFKELKIADIQELCFKDYPSPMYELYSELNYVALRTSTGCPFRCSYCAIGVLEGGKWERKPAVLVASEINKFYGSGIKNFVFYDDALFYKPEEHIIPILSQIQKLRVTGFFHTPNGLHARYLTKDLAKFLKKTNFIMPRLSLETVNSTSLKNSGDKLNTAEFQTACQNLQNAGFKKGEYGAYILMGRPGQDFFEIEESIKYANKNGAFVFIAEYSPIPGTADWEKIKNILPCDDPLWHNNSLFPIYELSEWKRAQELKNLTRELNLKVRSY
ncbi:MAG: radical SAM protein [Elusimicrobia bacterium]|nr:radical SAM protein [Candidatus Liberimonas magnetica]